MVNPEELNGQINFFTTSGFRGSDEFERNLLLIDEMAELKGKMVLGSDWQLACTFGRGETKSQLLEKKSKLSPTFFAMNYESKWVGASDGAIVNINKVMELRTLLSPELKSDGKSEYILSMDVARSMSKNNNQSSIAVLKIKRNKSLKITKIQLVNIINLPNGLNFEAQSVILKRARKIYSAKAVIVDINGLGVGLLDELLKDTVDPNTGESLGCWDTMNTDHQSELADAEPIIYAMLAQGVNHEIIVSFIDAIESNKLQLLQKKDNKGYDVNDVDYFRSNILPHIQTDLFIEEVANLKLKQNSNGRYTIEQLTKRVDKDRYSATAYGLWYIKNFEDNMEEEKELDVSSFLFFN
jgi:ribonucleoside-diphosphate reductase alpha chain